MESRYDAGLYDEVMDNLRESMFHEREGGVHLSDLVLCLNKAYLRAVRGEALATDDQVLTWLLGRMGEAWMRHSFSDAPAIQCEGIWCSVDHIGKATPWELKVTKMSTKRSVPPHWLTQVEGYCYARSKHFGIPCRDFAIVRMCIMGDYGKNRTVTLIPEVFTFTDEEIEENWSWLHYRKEMLLSCIDRDKYPSDVLPDFEGTDTSFNQCEYCSYNEMCKARR